MGLAYQTGISMPGVAAGIRNRLGVCTTTHLNGFGMSDRHFNAGCGGGENPPAIEIAVWYAKPVETGWGGVREPI